MSDNIHFSVTQKYGVTQIVNNTRLKLCVSIKATKPKRKQLTILILEPNSFTIHEGMDLVLDNLSFSLE